MRTSFFAFITLGFLSVAAIAPIAARQTSRASAPAAAPQEEQPPQLSQSGYVMKVKTRLVTLDVVATDSHGNVVRDLKPEELQVFEHSDEQKIAGFEFIDKLSNAPPARPPASTVPNPHKLYSNMVHFENLSIPPTVILMDSLNTPFSDRVQARTHMVRLLKTLPPDTPVAVFLLGSTLRLLQGFTSEPALLQTAVDRLLNPAADAEKNPFDDPNSASNSILDENGEQETAMTMQLEDFEKEQYASTIDLRARVTLDTMKEIARYLSGIPGRKNLIWLSESFPMSIDTDTEHGTDSFAGTRVYGQDVQAASNALSDAQVAIYPVDLRGLDANQSLSASQDIRPSRRAPGGGLPATLAREQNTRIQTQFTMSALAEDTGGKTCMNTNDLSGCVGTALKDGSSYYELAFYPEDIKWDGKFHKVVVKTTRRGVELTYRRGYFATDADALAKQQTTDNRLRETCSDMLPSTSIHLMAEAVPFTATPGQPKGLKYLLLIDPNEMSFPPNGGSFNVSIQAMTCEFGARGNSFRYFKQDITRTISNEVFQTWQAHGIPDYVTIAASAVNQRVRFAVLDVATGLTGALDVIPRPADLEIAVASPPPVPVPAPPPLVLKTNPILAIPDSAATQPGPKTMDRLTFHGQSGQSGTLTWSGDNLIYEGDLSSDQSAPAFFTYAFGAGFRCQTGVLVPLDAASGEPKLQLIFWNGNGKSATVDLKGAQPEYSGDLPVDASAKAFFDQVWQLSHCRIQ